MTYMNAYIMFLCIGEIIVSELIYIYVYSVERRAMQRVWQTELYI